MIYRLRGIQSQGRNRFGPFGRIETGGFFTDMKKLCLVVLLVLFTGCGFSQRLIQGTEPNDSLQDPIGRLQPSPNPIVIKGEVIEKGSDWLAVKDGTGKVRVEARSGHFDLSDIPLHCTVTVGGIYKPDKEIEATGIRTE